MSCPKPLSEKVPSAASHGQAAGKSLRAHNWLLLSSVLWKIERGLTVGLPGSQTQCTQQVSVALTTKRGDSHKDLQLKHPLLLPSAKTPVSDLKNYREKCISLDTRSVCH